MKPPLEPVVNWRNFVRNLNIVVTTNISYIKINRPNTVQNLNMIAKNMHYKMHRLATPRKEGNTTFLTAPFIYYNSNTMQNVFPQNIIAIIWDFDETMTPEPMQKVLFDTYRQDSNTFWDEVNQLSKRYQNQGYKQVSNTLVYLHHILDYVQQGKFKDLSNAQLKELGKGIEFYLGLVELLKNLKNIVKESQYSNYDLSLEHYVVSTGLKKLIEGSDVASNLTDIWGCEFIENERGCIERVIYVLDDTTKTRAIFEINKGVNKDSNIQVNSSIKEDQRRVPIEHMIYIADGPSDVPVFSVINKHGGRTLGVYNPQSDKKFKAALKLRNDERIDNMEEADFRANKPAARWLEATVREIADSIVKKREQKREQIVSPAPSY